MAGGSNSRRGSGAYRRGGIGAGGSVVGDKRVEVGMVGSSGGFANV